MRQLSGQDAGFIYGEAPHAPQHVGSIAIYDPSTAPGGRVTFKGILESLQARLHLAPVLRRRLVRVPMDLDHPYWIEDPNFDLEFHVRHVALPRPGDWRQLCIQAARLHSRPLDLNRPLWELTVVEGLDHVDGVPAGAYAYVMKTHSAAIDGATGTQLTTALHDLVADAIVPPPASPWEPEAVPNAWELLARAGMQQALRPLQFAELMSRALPELRAPSPRVARALTGAVLPPRTRFNGTVSAHRVVDAIELPLDDLRSVRALVERATVNDVVLAVVAGGLRRYLEAMGELPAEPLVSMVPVSVTDPGDEHTEGSGVAALIASLHTTVADPVERLAAIRDSTVGARAVVQAVGARHMTELAAFMPGALLGLATRLGGELAIANRATPMYNTVVTNIPGPQVPLYAAGARLVLSAGLGVLGDGLALTHVASSYCGTLVLSFTACRDALPDPATYAAALRASVEELLAAATPRPRPRRRAATSGQASGTPRRAQARR